MLTFDTMEEDRSGLFSEIGGFSQRKLKKVQTKVVTGTGETVVEKRSAKGIQASTADAAKGSNQDSSDGRKRDLQVGMVLPGLMIGKSPCPLITQPICHKSLLVELGHVGHVCNTLLEVIFLATSYELF